MRVMMTGGTGFVGSHTVRRFVEAGHEVRLLVRDADKVRRVFDPVGIAIPEKDVIVGDIVDEDSVSRAMEGCDAVYHGAALVDMRRKMAQRVLDTNAAGVRLVVGGAVWALTDPFIQRIPPGMVGVRHSQWGAGVEARDGPGSDECAVRIALTRETPGTASTAT